MYKNVNNKKTNNKFEEINKLNKINDALFIKKKYIRQGYLKQPCLIM